MITISSNRVASRNTGLLLPYTKADLLSVNISEFMSAEIESKSFLFMYITNHQFDFWLCTRFCCFTNLHQCEIKRLQRNCYYSKTGVAT